MHPNTCPRCLAYTQEDKLKGWRRCPSCSNMFKMSNSMITMEEVLQGRIKFDELSEELKANGEKLLEALNKFRAEYGKPMYVSSGYRTPEINEAAGGSKTSAHLSLQACDFADADGKLKEFVANDPTILDRCDLYMEDPSRTKSWLHLQVRKASKRIFKP